MDYICLVVLYRVGIVILFFYTGFKTQALRVSVPQQTVALGGGGAVLRCQYHLETGEYFQGLLWTGPNGNIFETPYIDGDGKIFTNGSFLGDFKRRGSVLPYYRGDAIMDVLVSLSEINYSDEGDYNCTVKTNSGDVATDTTKFILDYSTSHNTIQCHRPKPFHLWCSRGTVQVYALEYGWNQHRETCSFEPYGCTDGYRYPENRTHLDEFRGKCSERTVCYINPKPSKLKCYGFPVLVSTAVAVRYWCIDTTTKSTTVCHDEGTTPLWCASGKVRIVEMKFGTNRDPSKCTEYDQNSCVERYTLPANRSKLEQYIEQCDGRQECYINPNPVRLKMECLGYRGLISSFVTIYYKCEVVPVKPVYETIPHDGAALPHPTPVMSDTSNHPGVTTTSISKVISESLCWNIENNVLLVAAIASCGLIVGVLVTLLGEFLFHRCCHNHTNKHYEKRHKSQVDESLEAKELEELSIYRSDTYESLESPGCSMVKQVVDLEPIEPNTKSASLRGLCGGESYVNSKL